MSNVRRIIPGIEKYPDLEKQFAFAYGKATKTKTKGCGSCNSPLVPVIQEFQKKLQKRNTLSRMK